MALQLRSDKVSFCPRHWSTAVGGHVQSGESYEEAALREFQEEVGEISDLKFFSKDFYEAPTSPKKFIVAYESHLETLDKSECPDVERLVFFSFEEIKNMIERGEKFHPELLFLLKKHFLE
jgi:8-oxo-dGTP pyrophosphatase MutT (NUDIX family)